MKSQSNELPLKIQDLGNGTSHFNYNIVEETTDDGTIYSYDQTIINNPVNYGKIVNELVKQRYSITDELSIQRQKETKPDEFLEYFNYVESCKNLAKNE